MATESPFHSDPVKLVTMQVIVVVMVVVVVVAMMEMVMVEMVTVLVEVVLLVLAAGVILTDRVKDAAEWAVTVTVASDIVPSSSLRSPGRTVYDSSDDRRPAGDRRIRPVWFPPYASSCFASFSLRACARTC